MAVFALLGAGACLFAGLLLAFPGTALDAAWSVNPRGHEGFVRMGLWAFLLLAVVGIGCIAASRGLWTGREWGRRFAMAGLSVNLVADAANALFADPRAWIGVPIAAVLIAYLASSRARAFFRPGVSRWPPVSRLSRARGR